MKGQETTKIANNGRWSIHPGKLLLILALAIFIANFHGVEAEAVIGDPLASTSFAMEVEGATMGYFTECTGIGSETEVVEHRIIGPGGERVAKIPGRLIWNNIILKRGITSNLDMWQWRKQVEDGDIANARKNISIVLYDQTMQPVARWDLINGWPSMINTSVAANGSLIEEVVLVCEGIERVNP